MSYINTKDTLGGDEAALDALIAHTLTTFTDEDVTELGYYAFYNQTQMTEIVLPGLNKIGSNAFYDCSNLQRIKVGLENSGMATLSNQNALTNTGRSIIYVPDSLVSTYRAGSNWSTYADRIYGISDLGLYEWDETEITDTPDEIAAKVAAGTAATAYKIGQYKTIDLGTEGEYAFQIIGVQTDELADGSGNYAQLSWFGMQLPSTYKAMNSTEVQGNATDGYTSGTGAIGGWAASEMRSYLNSTMYDLLPTVWQGMIKSVKKYSCSYDTTGSKTVNEETTDKLWLLSIRETFGVTGYETSGPIYSMAFINTSSRCRKKVGASSTTYWWLRSACNSAGFWIVSSSGSTSSTSPTVNYGVGFGFST